MQPASLETKFFSELEHTTNPKERIFACWQYLESQLGANALPHSVTQETHADFTVVFQVSQTQHVEMHFAQLPYTSTQTTATFILSDATFLETKTLKPHQLSLAQKKDITAYLPADFLPQLPVHVFNQKYNLLTIQAQIVDHPSDAALPQRRQKRKILSNPQVLCQQL